MTKIAEVVDLLLLKHNDEKEKKKLKLSWMFVWIPQSVYVCSILNFYEINILSY